MKSRLNCDETLIDGAEASNLTMGLIHCDQIYQLTGLLLNWILTLQQ